MLNLIRNSNMPPAKKGRSKHHTSDNSSATAMKRSIQNRLSSTVKKTTLFGDKYRITHQESIFLTADENAAVANPPDAASLAAAAGGGVALVGGAGNYAAKSKDATLQADRDAKSGNAKKNLKKGQRPKGGNQGTYLYFKGIFPSMSLNSVTK